MALLIFDYDGTLYDSMKVFGPAFRYCWDKVAGDGHLPQRRWTDKDIEIFLGGNADDMWRIAAPDAKEEIKADFHRYMKEEGERQIAAGKATLFPGVIDMLRALKDEGHTLLILSNCMSTFMDRQRNRFHLDDYFSGYTCAGDYGWQPKENLAGSLLAKYKMPAIVIGDRKNDRDGAKKNHLPFIACTYGYGNKKEWQDADAFASAPADIPKCIHTLLSTSS